MAADDTTPTPTGPAETTAPAAPPGYPSGPTGPPGAFPPMAAPPAYAYPAGPPGLQVPAGVVLAPVGRRIGAYFLSLLLFIVTLGIGWIIWGLILWPQGQSPAFRVLKLYVVPKEGGTPVGFGKMALRDIVGGIAQGIVGWITLLVSFILFLARDLHQPFTDLIAGTTVVHDPTGVYDGMRANPRA